MGLPMGIDADFRRIGMHPVGAHVVGRRTGLLSVTSDRFLFLLVVNPVLLVVGVQIVLNLAPGLPTPLVGIGALYRCVDEQRIARAYPAIALAVSACRNGGSGPAQPVSDPVAGFARMIWRTKDTCPRLSPGPLRRCARPQC